MEVATSAAMCSPPGIDGLDHGTLPACDWPLGGAPAWFVGGALTALRAHRDREAFNRQAAGETWTDQDLVFCDTNGEPLSPTTETKRFQRAVTKAGLPAIRLHDLCHTCTTILLLRGVHVKLVSEMSAHSSIVLTLDTYSHVIPAMHGDAAAAMDAVFRA